MKCPRCNEQSPEGKKWCGDCGAFLGPEIRQQIDSVLNERLKDKDLVEVGIADNVERRLFERAKLATLVLAAVLSIGGYTTWQAAKSAAENTAKDQAKKVATETATRAASAIVEDLKKKAELPEAEIGTLKNQLQAQIDKLGKQIITKEDETIRAINALPMGKQFSIPRADLERWSHEAVSSITAKVDGHSPVHPLNFDCEMNIGAHSKDYRGDPDGLVFEPMNVCVSAFPGQTAYSTWSDFADSLTGQTVRAEGVVRIWPEQLSGLGSVSNPQHVIELHPLTKVTVGTTVVDFRGFVFAGDYRGGVSELTAANILQDTRVRVQETSGMVHVAFDSGRIGNFTVLKLRLNQNSITALPGGHRIDAEVILDDSQVSVSCVTVIGSPIDSKIGTLRDFEALVLFALAPETLLKAADQSKGQKSPVEAQKPIRLIVYGPPS
jgi:cell division protein FtsB